MVLDDYVPQEFPKAKYHASEQPRVVNNPEEEKLLGDGWFNHPDLAKPSPAQAYENVFERALTAKRGPGRPPKVAETTQ